MEIYFCDIGFSTTTKLTNNNYSDIDPMARGQKIVWSYYDGPDEENGDYEIMRATATPDPDACPGNFIVIPATNGNTAIFYL